MSARPLPFLQRGDNGAVPARPGTGSGRWALFRWARGRGGGAGLGGDAAASPHTPGVGESRTDPAVPYRLSEHPERGGNPPGRRRSAHARPCGEPELCCCHRFWL